MPTKKYTAIVLDLFDTIVKWDPELLPLYQFQGREFRSTVPWFIERLKEALDNEAFRGRLDHEAAIAVYFEVLKELHNLRERDMVEITCHERFARMLTRLEYGSDAEIAEFAHELRTLHMTGVRRVTAAPPQRVAAVKQIAGDYRLGLLSNFDDAETGLQIVHDTGLAPLFEAIIISAEVGLRKPNPKIFHQIAAMMHLEPREILFVGDTPRFDITGPHQVGMGTVWLNDGKEPLTPDIPDPDFIIKDLTELPALLKTLE
ncbi:MAG: HAD family hydrolase [Candidatus Binataceae bacterium]